MLIKCPECAALISDKASVCMQCGYPIEKAAVPDVECPKCYRKITNTDYSYCPFCGYSLHDSSTDNFEKEIVPTNLKIKKVPSKKKKASLMKLGTNSLLKSGFDLHRIFYELSEGHPLKEFEESEESEDSIFYSFQRNNIIHGIKSIKRANEEPPKTANTVIISEQGPVTYAWKDLNTLYIYSTSPYIFINQIAGDMFADFYSLSEIDLPGLRSDLVTSMAFMFNNCGIKKLNLHDFVTSNVSEMENMFYGCSSLEDLIIDSFDTSNVTNMSSMFKDCSSLKALSLDSFDTSNVTDMSSMFCNCRHLTSLNLKSFNTKELKSMNSMFMDCRMLSSLDLSHFQTRYVSNCSRLFSECRSLQYLNFANFDSCNLDSNYEIFKGCYKLKEIETDDPILLDCFAKKD